MKRSEYKVGIIGGSGYVGHSLVKYLKNYYDIKVIDIITPKDCLPGVDYCECDIQNFNELEKTLSDVSVVIHTAIIQIPLINEKKDMAYRVNILGTQNVCRAVYENNSIEGMILAGSWHTIGERNLSGFIDENFGYRPNQVEERAKYYALSKVTQECIVRIYDELSNKIFGIIRMGTILGNNMPIKTAANIFIDNGLNNQDITPYKESLYRPMFYISIEDICKIYKNMVELIVADKLHDQPYEYIYNAFYPKPITIYDLATLIMDLIKNSTNGKIMPTLKIIDNGKPDMFKKEDILKISVSINKLKNDLNITHLMTPEKTLHKIIKMRLQ